MNEIDFCEVLRCTLEETEHEFDGRPHTRSFGEAGLMTNNEGLVVRLADGTEFQVQIVKSR